MNNWTWLLIGVGAGYFLARTGVGFGGGLAFSANVGASAPPGSGEVPLDQPTGSAPYQQVGAYNPYYSAGFPDLIDNGASGVIIEADVTGQGYLQ